MAPEPALPAAPEPAPSVGGAAVEVPAARTAATATAEDTIAHTPRRRGRRRTVVVALLAALAVVAILVAAGTAWYLQPRPLLPEATAALASTAAATYTEEPTGLTYTPVGMTPTTGLILYPGARVPAAAYAPGARAIAEEGYLVVIVPMPFNLANFGVNAADGVMAAHPGIAHWAIGGHSLGGAMAAEYAAGHLGTIAGLALCGAYSAADLSTSSLAVSSVFGSLDQAAAKITDPATQALLPASTVYDEVVGGNHEQCGWYTGQPNDPPATVSRSDQQVRMIAAWIAMLQAIAAP